MTLSMCNSALDTPAAATHSRHMQRLWLCVLATCAACGGVAIGDPGKEEVADCTERAAEAVSDPAKVPHGFEHSPNQQLAPLTGTWRGTLDLTHGKTVPLTVEISVDVGSIRAVYATDANTTCDPWFTATVTLVIDAGPTLRGTAHGELTVHGEAQIRAEWIAFADFESTLEAPDFGAEIISGPALLFDFLSTSDGEWRAEWQFAAQVKGEPCNPQRCPGLQVGSIPMYQSIGNVVLPRREAP